MKDTYRGSLARQNFFKGYNCPQSVVLAYEDILVEHGIDPKMMTRLSSTFGGGMGRLREVCGAVSGMLMILGLVEGYDDPEVLEEKGLLYEHVQTLVGRFKEEQGAILCRDLLGLGEGASNPMPAPRTDDYYDDRPCPDFIACAASILEEYLQQ